MASRRQRARKQARRVQHGLAAQQARHEALATAPSIVSPGALREHMEEHGYEQDHRGKWRRVWTAVTSAGRAPGQRRGPVLKPKKRRR